MHKPEGYQKRPLPGLTEWVSELRSGKFLQGQAYLCNVTDGIKRFCCLGLYSFLHNTLEERNEKFFDCGVTLGTIHGDNPVFHYLHALGDLPNGCRVAVDKWNYTSLSQLNDIAFLNFKEISDILEELFVDL